MATIKPESSHAGRSLKDLTPYQWHAARLLSEKLGTQQLLASDDTIDVAPSTQDAAGIIYEPGKAAGLRTTIIVSGRAKLKMTGTGKAQASVKITDGKGSKAEPEEPAFAYALADWADGDIVPVFIDRHTAKQGSPEPRPEAQVLQVDTPVNLTMKTGTQQVFSITAPADGTLRVYVNATIHDTEGSLYGPDGTLKERGWGAASDQLTFSHIEAKAGETYTVALNYLQDSTLMGQPSITYDFKKSATNPAPMFPPLPLNMGANQINLSANQLTLFVVPDQAGLMRLGYDDQVTFTALAADGGLISSGQARGDAAGLGTSGPGRVLQLTSYGQARTFTVTFE